MVVVGVDGCHGGWFAVGLSGDGSWAVGVFKSISEVTSEWSDADLILVDIPIGLRSGTYDERERTCDREARRLLGRGRASSVFPAPCYEALKADSYERASAINREHTGRGLSLQSWAIAGKIAEVNGHLVAESSGPTVREVHPEVCFWALNGCQPMQHSKRTTEGQHERIQLLDRLYSDTGALIEYALRQHQRKQVARDDITDALVAAVTGLDGESALESIPETPETDSKGNRMEMVYRKA